MLDSLGLYLLAVWFLLNIIISIYFLLKDIFDGHKKKSSTRISERVSRAYDSSTMQEDSIFAEKKSKKNKFNFGDLETPSLSKPSNKAKISIKKKGRKAKKGQKIVISKKARIKAKNRAVIKRRRQYYSKQKSRSNSNNSKVNMVKINSQNSQSIFSQNLGQSKSKSNSRYSSNNVNSKSNLNSVRLGLSSNNSPSSRENRP